MLIDTHAHLDDRRFDGDRAELLGRAHAAGIGAILAIGIGEGPAEMGHALALCRQYNGQSGVPRLYASAGVYPHSTPDLNDGYLTELDRLLAAPEVIACGEIGLDYYHQGAPHELQQRALIQQLELAAAHKRPILIHCRPTDGTSNTWDDLFPILDRYWASTGLGGIMHCFSGTLPEARRSIDLGFLISCAGHTTYPKSQPLREVFAQLPLESLVVETDAPYLAPLPERGKRNETAFLRHTALTLAETLGLSVVEIESATTKNFFRLFRLHPDVGN